ncbi:Flp pilus assembly protein TadD/glycosyltransferase involved in cell wall biosynthesis [Azospirillum sp. OGB3]|uniref:tetratricopeptide repeat-containing glycosyltransferase family protein n=1 Tax=Azospirillum sp. OGB3 TaxID=2587012 RepID=UPI001606345D|nr:tetratricopeptide repeat protein [Azospirillum sp. OGB3]MBB3268522.1 Flp pilus assembly protein TadD/glycosyltransferase involved in cell wall biosynthesis [Azospirillum sp. OGB3]
MTDAMTGGIEVASRHYGAGRLTEAIDACRAVLAVEPGRFDALNLLGAALFSTGQDGPAREALREAVRADPGNAAALTNFSIVLQHRQEWPAAACALRALAAVQPETAPLYSRLGTVFQEMGDLDGAVRFLVRAARLDPRPSVQWYNLGLIGILAGDFVAAVHSLHRAIAITPEGGLAYVQLGETLLRLGRVDEAAGVFGRTLRLDPTVSDAVNGLARCARYRAAAHAAAHAVGSEPGARKGLAVRGALTSATGYGYFCQRFVRTLRKRAVPLQAIGIAGPESWREENLDPPVPARALVNFLIPLAVERVPGLATVTFSMFEGTRIPPAWRRQCENSDLVIVPTESSRMAWAAQGYPEDRLRVCPLGVDPEASDGVASAPTMVDPRGRLVSSYRHRFINVSDFIPRKNIDGLLRVWLRSTARTDDAVLILKLGKGSNPAFNAELGNLVRRTEDAVGKRMADAAPVVLINQLLSDADMTGLLRSATHYWSMSHGEGWDLPLSKAGALGLSLIAPRHSSYVDYLDDRVARLIPAAVRPARLPYSEQAYPPFHGLDWWDPDEGAAADILTAIIRGGDTGPPSARDHLVQGFSWTRAADRLLAILDDAGLR